MGRHARFEKEQIVEAAKRVIAERGPRAATVSAIAHRLGAPTGSIYHRYSSRELLLADLWLEVVDQFQKGFLSKLRGEDPMRAAVRAATYGAAWVREHLAEARLLLLHRRKDFVAGSWPAEVRKRADDLRRDLENGVRDFTRRLYGRANAANLRRVRFAVLHVPYGAVKPYLEAGETPPPDVEGLVKETCLAILGK